MKKYIKPELFYEHYELAQHIADCDWEMTSVDKNVCVAYGDEDMVFAGERLFVTDDVCSITEGTLEEYCYQTGVDGALKVFAS